MPRVLELFVRDWNLLSLEEAVRKMTSLPAGFFRLDGRGTIAVGNWADSVIFDPATIRDRATYRVPAAYPEGISAVLINGEMAALDGHATGRLAGRVLLRGQ